MYWRGMPIIWRSQRQSVRSYSTCEAEFIAASDTIVLSETNDFMSFFKLLPQKIAESNHGVSPSLEDAILWVDNQSAIIAAQSKDTKPKSRHYALRYHRVRDSASKIVFCPTTLMKADALTKLECSAPQRRLLLHHVSDPVIYPDSCDLSDEENSFDNDFKAFLSIGMCVKMGV